MYDDAGRMVRTVVTREPEWDDAERAKMEGLALYERQICACGLHESVAETDPEMEIVLPVCPVCAGLAKQLRILEAKDEGALKALGEKPRPEAARPSDGRRINLRWKGPGVASVAQEAVGNES